MKIINYILLLLIATVVTSILKAQEFKLPDSLQLQLDTTKVPENKAWALLEAGEISYQSHTIAAYNRASTYFQQALELSQKINHKQLISYSYVSLAGVYDALGNEKLPKALEYYTIFKDYCLTTTDTATTLRSYMNIINVQQKLMMATECKYNMEKMTALAKAYNKWPNTNRVFALAAFYASRLNEEGLCRKYLAVVDTSKATITNSVLPYLRYYLMSNLYLLGKDKKFSEALSTGLKALESVGNKSDSMQVYYQLAEFAGAAGFYKEAYQYRTIERDLNNQIVNQASMSEASNTLLQSELKLKGENEKLLQQKQRSQQTLNKFLIIGISLLAVFFTLLLWQVIARRKQNIILLDQVEENKLLMNEVHHRVKNNLQIISSFMLLQQAKNSNTENDELLKQLQSKIGALALVHQMLQNQQVHEKVIIKNYFEQLTTQVVATQTNNGNSLQCVVDMDETVLSLDSITSLAFIAIELLLNTIKYVVPYQPATEAVLTARADKNKLLFTYSDSGPGLPPEIDIHKPTTTGLRLIKRLAAQLGSQLETYRDAEKFVYKIEIPV